MSTKTSKLYFHPVKSSQIREIAHDKDVLYVRFRNHKVYSYSPVNAKEFEKFKAAESIGSYFHKNFKANSKLKIDKITNGEK